MVTPVYRSLSPLVQMLESTQQAQQKLTRIAESLINGETAEVEQCVQQMVGTALNNMGKIKQYQDLITEDLNTVGGEKKRQLQVKIDEINAIFQESQQWIIQAQNVQNQYEERRNERLENNINLVERIFQSQQKILERQSTIITKIIKELSKKGEKLCKAVQSFANGQTWPECCESAEQAHQFFDDMLAIAHRYEFSADSLFALSELKTLSNTLWSIGKQFQNENHIELAVQFFNLSCNIDKTLVIYCDLKPPLDDYRTDDYRKRLQLLIDKYIDMYPLCLEEAINNILLVLEQVRNDIIEPDKVLALYAKAFIPESEETLPSFSRLWIAMRNKLEEHHPKELEELELLTCFKPECKIPSLWVSHQRFLLSYSLLIQEGEVLCFAFFKHEIIKAAIPKEKFKKEDKLSFFLARQPKNHLWFQYADYILKSHEEEIRNLQIYESCILSLERLKSDYSELEEIVPQGREAFRHVEELKSYLVQIERTRERNIFGKNKWEIYFGDVGEVPPLPSNIEAILDSPYPVCPDKKIKDTCMLVLIPEKVNGEPFTLNLLEKLIQAPKSGGHAIKYKDYDSRIKERLGEKSYPSHWVLMSKDVIPGSQRVGFHSDLIYFLNDFCKITPYYLPRALDVATCILMEYVQTGICHEDSNLITYTRCRNRWSKADSNPIGFVVIGDFDSTGLNIHFDWSCSSHEESGNKYSSGHRHSTSCYYYRNINLFGKAGVRYAWSINEEIFSQRIKPKRSCLLA